MARAGWRYRRRDGEQRGCSWAIVCVVYYSPSMLASVAFRGVEVSAVVVHLDVELCQRLGPGFGSDVGCWVRVGVRIKSRVGVTPPPPTPKAKTNSSPCPPGEARVHSD
jgi:hypothetical protein